MERDLNARIEELARDVMTYARNTLYVNLRFMDVALGQFRLVSTPAFRLATDGRAFFYNPKHVLSVYKTSSEEMARHYLHVVLHCVFRHLFVSPSIHVPTWNLACDIAVESVITELNLSAVRSLREARQKIILTDLKNKLGILTAEKIYRYYLNLGIDEAYIPVLGEAFVVDDHALWYSMPENANRDGQGDEEGDQSQSGRGQRQPRVDDEQGRGQRDDDGQNGNGSQGDGTSRSALDDRWKDIAEQLLQDLETFSKSRGDQAGGLMQNLREVTRERYDYTAFLKKFATMHEAMTVNDEEFDYVYYTYGLRLYKKMPLIEPLEYKEIKRIRDFVIAIDTSGSVRGDLVQTFLQKTFNILKSEESFFVKFNLHVVQCDATVQEDVKITTQEEFDHYIANMTLRGFGGTDFRPVFTYVDSLIAAHEFTNLKGLIYFTDGYGVFPERKPAYETAFVFVYEGFDLPEIPPWAIKLVLRPDEV